MTPAQARDLEPGDLVHSKSWEDDPAQEVEKVNFEQFPHDPMVFFKKGGFWRSSALRKV